MRVEVLFLCAAAAASMGASATVRQSASAPGGAASSQAAALSDGMAANIDRAMASTMNVTLQNDPLKNVFANLRKSTNTNLVVNWAALARAGITPETPVTLTLKGATYEEVVRCVLETLPLKGTRGNYAVGGNTLEVTTNAELSKGASPQLFQIERAILYSPTGRATPAQEAEHARLVGRVVESELLRAGEPLDKKAGRAVAVKGTSLAANVSDRGQAILEGVLSRFAQPVKPNAPVANVLLTRKGRDTEAALRKLVSGPGDLAALAKDPAKAATFNVVVLPAAAAELAKPQPGELGEQITPGGTVLIGTAEEMALRWPLVVFDLRDVIKRTIARAAKPQPGVGEVQDRLVKAIQAAVAAPGVAASGGRWGDIGTADGTGPAMVVSDGLLLVVAPVAVQEQIAAEVAKLYK